MSFHQKVTSLSINNHYTLHIHLGFSVIVTVSYNKKLSTLRLCKIKSITSAFSSTQGYEDPHKTLPSVVVHVRGLVDGVTEADLVEALQEFGAIR